MSNFKIQCPACQSLSMVPEEFAHKTIRCPSCKQTFKMSPDVIIGSAAAATADPVAIGNPLGTDKPILPASGSPFQANRRKSFNSAKQHKKVSRELSSEDHIYFRIGIFMIGGGIAACLTPYMDIQTRGIVELLSKAGPIAGTVIGLAGAGMVGYGGRGQVYGLPTAGIGAICVIACSLFSFFNAGTQNNNQAAYNPPFEYEKSGGIKRPKRIERPESERNDFSNFSLPAELEPQLQPPVPETGFENPFRQSSRDRGRSRTQTQAPENNPFDNFPTAGMPPEAKKQFEEARKRHEEFRNRVANRRSGNARGIFSPPGNQPSTARPTSNSSPDSFSGVNNPFETSDENSESESSGSPFEEAGEFESSTGAKKNSNATFSVGQKVEVRWGQDWHRSTILKSVGDEFKVHYDGWADSFDEVVPKSRIRQLDQ